MIMVKQDYIRKALHLLLISIFRSVKLELGLDKITYKQMYSTGATSLKFHSLQIIHKKDTI